MHPKAAMDCACAMEGVGMLIDLIGFYHYSLSLFTHSRRKVFKSGEAL